MTMVIALLFIEIAYFISVSSDYELILHEKLSVNNNFPNFAAVFASNENDPSSELYSIVGQWNDNESKQNLYKDDGGKFQFKLVYVYADDSEVTIEFKQSNWLNEDAITGYELITSSGLPDLYSPVFSGLFNVFATRTTEHCYISGGQTTHSAVGNCYWTVAAGPDYSKQGAYTVGIKGFAQQVSLYVYPTKANCEDVTCSFGSVCDEDTGECAEQCSIFDMDGYSDVCSTNLASVDELNAQIDTVNGQIDAVNDRIDGITMNVPERESTIPLINNDLIIIGLVISNILLLCYICYIHSKIGGNKSNYKTIKVYSSSEDEQKPMNQL